MDILRIATAGSVDDGKSTLIGRMLYETSSVTQDKLDAIEQASRRRGIDYPDLSLLTDGLVAEREQGITIDVAHIYFSTPRRKYIVADTPGHFEYTRNMITGASTAQVAIILVDARNGIAEQTRRHYYITQILRIPYLVVCVNKMDLAAYSEDTFTTLCHDFKALAASATYPEQQLTFIPVAALWGENIARKSDAMPWYTGPHLLAYLESIDYTSIAASLPARFPVQQVIRPKSEQYHDFRGFAGRVTAGVLRIGDRVVALPSQQKSVVEAVFAGMNQTDAAVAGQSVVLTLADEIDLSRGGMLVPENDAPQPVKEITAQVCWLDSTPLVPGKTYTLQHGVNRVKSKITEIISRISVETLVAEQGVGELRLNEIGIISLRLAQPVFAESYAANKYNGAFILIDEQTHTTSGVAFVM
ncbi:MAG: GTP-binding protein [Bacteroidia bacterium]|jgi:sulfate adenylyltransferase subunit 1|nr:GTP-binding protein [Bacteroidia bacterium]